MSSSSRLTPEPKETEPGRTSGRHIGVRDPGVPLSPSVVEVRSSRSRSGLYGSITTSLTVNGDRNFWHPLPGRGGCRGTSRRSNSSFYCIFVLRVNIYLKSIPYDSSSSYRVRNVPCTEMIFLINNWTLSLRYLPGVKWTTGTGGPCQPLQTFIKTSIFDPHDVPDLRSL